MRIAWGTDVHFNFVGERGVREFCSRLQAADCEALLLSGDIAEAHDLERWLGLAADIVQRPIYFVLGNHDYYRGDVASVRKLASELPSPWLHWLPNVGVVALTDTTALVGHGGWGDARLGDFVASPIILNDYILIADLREAGGERLGRFARLDPDAVQDDKLALQRKLGELGDEAARALRPAISEALERYPRVIVLTHVPPFKGSCWHEGQISNDDWLPAFTCKAMGDMLQEVAGDRADREVTVLCGHTHSEGENRPLANLHVITGGAEYGAPDFRVLTVE